MLVKFILWINNASYELKPDDLMNWADVECIYSRTDYTGIIRSVMSEFHFVNEAYRRILALYCEHGFKAEAEIELKVIDDNWRYNSIFRCFLDFGTITYNEYVLKLFAIDSSINSKIKANKATRYEFSLGEDIPVNPKMFRFDRLEMLETVTYAITDGESRENGALYASYDPQNNGRIYVGLTQSEIGIGRKIYYKDDQEYVDGYMLKAVKMTKVKLDYTIAASIERGCKRLVLMKDDAEVATIHEGCKTRKPWLEKDQESLEQVMDYIHSEPYLEYDWANESWQGEWISINDIVYVAETDPILGTNRWESTGKTRMEFTSVESSGTVEAVLLPGQKLWLKLDSSEACEFSINKSELAFTWTNRGNAEMIDNVDPEDLLKAILAKMGVGADCTISHYDARLPHVILLPAESIREIPQAKIYASFDDFCKWIQAVFGYTYVVDEDNNMVEFKHRREIFNPSSDVFEVRHIKDLDYSIDESLLYSSVIVGYPCKDYDSVNGRDEFNFSSTYTTGFTLRDKNLELLSAFRADSYGIEFLVEKRGESTTDNESDQDIFFVTGIDSGTVLVPNRTIDIQNSITGTLLNGEFSPMRCAHANKDSISMVADDLTLTFASTDGNADIVIDGHGMSDDIELTNCDMLSPGILQFYCGDLDMPADINSLVRVSSGNYIYEGYIKRLHMKYAREESVQYHFFVKSITPCS